MQMSIYVISLKGTYNKNQTHIVQIILFITKLETQMNFPVNLSLVTLEHSDTRVEVLEQAQSICMNSRYELMYLVGKDVHRQLTISCLSIDKDPNDSF